MKSKHAESIITGYPLKKLACLFAVLLFSAGTALAYENEVYESGGSYYWKISNVVSGSNTNLAEAINRCIWDGPAVTREIHILSGGDLPDTIAIRPDISLYGHGNTFRITSHGNYGFYARGTSNIGFYDMTLTNSTDMVFRTTACDNVVFSGIHIDGGFIGMRVDSRDSEPWLAWSYNLTVTNCTFENLTSHGLETYSIDSCYVDGITASNNVECGICFNNTRNGVVGSVDAYRCAYGGGYAGLRMVNGCRDITVDYLKAVECGRGFFSGTVASNIVVNEVYIRDCSANAFLIQMSDQVGVNSGSFNGIAINHYTSTNCWILADFVFDAVPLPGAQIPLFNASFELPSQYKISTGFDVPSFDVPGWSDFGPMSNSGIEDSSFGGHSGIYSAVLMGGDGGAYQMTGYTIQEGDVFTLGYWAKIDWTGSTCAMTATLFWDTPNSGSNEIGSYAADPLTSDWVYHEYTVAASAASVGHELGVQFVNTQTDWGALDDVTLSVVSPIRPEEWFIQDHAITGGTNLLLSVSNSVPGHAYQVLSTDNLLEPDWQSVGSSMEGDGSILQFTVPVGAIQSNRYFKLDVQIQQ